MSDDQQLSYKQGIPLLEAFEDKVEEEGSDDEDFDPTASRIHIPKGKLPALKSFCSWKVITMSVVIALICICVLTTAIAVPVTLIHFKPEIHSKPEEVESQGEVIKSPLDSREYKVIVLRNDLRVLLVSDNETEDSAAAMDVAVGSFSNPSDYEGLAHFCEHMLFYGSEKYPDEGAYSKFLTSHGGYDNAYTSTLNTNYHFKVNSDYLREGLDRFAQFFISPILTQDGVSREVNAVDAEHQKNLENDGWRLWQLLKHVSNPDYPFHMFSTGSLETLDKPDVLSALKQFYSSHYSANQMQLVIYGREDTNTLTSYAEDIFSDIPNKNISRPIFENTSFPNPYNGKIVYYVPVADTNSLSIVWQVNPLINKYREQVSNVLSRLFGDEGHGSILHYLRKQNWATSLSADVEINTDTHTLYVVDITLTNSGLKHVSDVIAVVIQYANLLKDTTPDQWQQIWNDFVNITAINFKYTPKSDADSFVSSLSSTMRNTQEPADFLSPPERYVFNFSNFTETLSFISPSTPIIFLGSKNLSDTSNFNQESSTPLPLPHMLSKTEPIYGTVYEEISISEDLTSSWNKVESQGEVIKSSLDSREYKVIVLRNDLRVLLVSDNETEDSAAAMDVAVGSFSNPSDYEGLAHFCEHMLFYGSKKYPDEGAYSKFLTSHGGYDNAYTSTLNTNYHFKVNSDYLREGLDRFAQFFISPILTQDGVSREVNAVDAEHQKNLENDGWRLWQLLKHVSNPDYPFHMFSTGSLETLNKSGVLSTLEQFYSSYYSANQMQLVIYGREDTNTLTSYAEDIFSDIPNKDISRPIFENTSFPNPYNGKIVYYVPVADTNSLFIVWQVNPLINKYREQVSNVLSRLFGDEGHGSILHYLRKQNWATSLSADVEINTDTHTLYVVDITLTNSGLKHVSDVIAVVIQYANLLKDTTPDQWQQIWNDFVNITAINFKYTPKSDADSFVSSLSSTMRNTQDPADFLSPPERYVLNFSNFTETLSCISPSTPIIFLGSKNLSDTSNFNQESSTPLPLPDVLSKTEPIYGTVYEEISISEDLTSSWNKFKVSLSIPPTNQFIPQHLDILSPPQPTQDVPIRVDEVEDGMSVWWLQDTVFHEPTLNIYCDINSPQTKYSMYDPQWTALTSLYTTVVQTNLISELYPASLIGYSYNIFRTAHGVRLTISGYSDETVIKTFIKVISNGLHNETILKDEGMFSLALESLINSYANYNYTALPYRYTYEYIQSLVMERPSWHNWQILHALQNNSVTTDLLLNHVQTLLADMSSLLCFVHGNANSSQAVEYTKLIYETISSSSIDPKGQYNTKRLSLSPGNYSVIVPTLNPNDANSVINVLFQIGHECELEGKVCSSLSLKTAALASILNLQMQQSCFDVLRTQQQLGYVAYCTHRVNEGIGSFQVLVQSGTQNASLVLDRINEFLSVYKNDLTTFLSNVSNFENLKAVYRDIVLKKDITLSDATTRNWNQISSGLQQFNYTHQIVNIADSITSDQLLQFYQSSILDTTTSKKLVIAVYGFDKKSTVDAVFQNNIDFTHLDPHATGYP